MNGILNQVIIFFAVRGHLYLGSYDDRLTKFDKFLITNITQLHKTIT